MVGGITTGILDQMEKYTWLKLQQLRSVKLWGGGRGLNHPKIYEYVGNGFGLRDIVLT